MKKSFFLLFFAVFCSFWVLAQDSYFTVKVGSFLDASPKDFESIRDLGVLHINRPGGNNTEVFIGGFDKREDAQAMINQLRTRGFDHGFIQQYSINDGQVATVIQITTTSIKKALDWERYSKAGKLFTILNKDKVKVVTGVYPSLESAKQDLARVRNTGFKDAFIKKVNSIFLHEVSEYATGIKKPLIPIALDQRPPTPRTPPPSSNTTPVIKTQETARKGVPVKESVPVVKKEVPETYEEPSFKTTKPVEYSGSSRKVVPQKNNSLPLPKVRTKVKRKSVIDLQRVLEKEKTYTMKVDGYYGKGTRAAYEKAVSKNQVIQKYIAILENSGSNTLPTANDPVQNAINNLVDDPAAQAVLEGSGLNIAQAYEAYMLFNTLDASREVDALMNAAIKDAYEGKTFNNSAPFDYNSTYSYQNIDQLVLHLFYIHAAPGSKYSAPCWLFDLHPDAAGNAFAKVGRHSDGDFHLQSCDLFLQWEPLKLTQAIASDLNPDGQFDSAKLSKEASKRAQIFLAPKVPNAEERKELDDWYLKKWKNLNAWSGKDPLNKKLVTALKISYFESQVRLEDHFMDKGFKKEQAKGLALQVLQSTVGYHLQRFSKV